MSITANQMYLSVNNTQQGTHEILYAKPTSYTEKQVDMSVSHIKQGTHKILCVKPTSNTVN